MIICGKIPHDVASFTKQLKFSSPYGGYLSELSQYSIGLFIGVALYSLILNYVKMLLGSIVYSQLKITS